MTYCDRRLGGVERWYVTRPKDAGMRVDSNILKTVAFLCTRTIKNGIHRDVYRGTGFFLAWCDPEDPPHIGVIYFVTARHIVERARGAGQQLYVRANVRSGGVRYFALSDDEWSEADTADVAVQMLVLREADMQLVPQDMCLTDEALAAHDVGVGDDLLLCGLFEKHYGLKENRPIVRSGIISAMPADPVAVKNAPAYPGYLAEVRSIGGLSGSPVFIVFEYERPSGKRFEQPPIFVLGIVRGHWDVEPGMLADDTQAKRELETMNVGIAVVTPIQEVVHLIMRDDVSRPRRAFMRDGLTADGATLDSMGDEEDSGGPGTKPERLNIKGDWADAARRALRAGKPSKGGKPRRKKKRP